MERNIVLDITQSDRLITISEALANRTRVNFLKLIISGNYSINELAMITNTPMSTTSFHLQILRKAGLIKVSSNPHKRGNEKIVSHIATSIQINLVQEELSKSNLLTFNIPVGSFSSASVVAPCGIADKDGITYEDDQPGMFYSPLRIRAELVWFTKGYVEYTIPTYAFKGKNISSISFSLELCSECPNYRDDWKSSITFWINDKEVCTYLSPGDFGGHRGKYTPSNWSESATQYGLLKFFKVNEYGTFLDENMIGLCLLDDLNLCEKEFFTFRIGIKDDAKYVGGINIFGARFGNYNQDIVIHIETTV